MSPSTNHRGYEFDEQEDASFSKLAAAMTFVAVAMAAAGILALGGAVLLSRQSVVGGAMFAPAAMVVVVMAVQLLQAASHFRRIVHSHGNDIGNLMTAVDEMIAAYRLQRWLWVVVAVVVLVALATTIIGR